MHAITRVALFMSCATGAPSYGAIVYRNPGVQIACVPRFECRTYDHEGFIIEFSHAVDRALREHRLHPRDLARGLHAPLRLPTPVPGTPHGYALVLYLAGSNKRPFRVDVTLAPGARPRVSGVRRLNTSDHFFYTHAEEALVRGDGPPMTLNDHAYRQVLRQQLSAGDLRQAMTRAVGRPIPDSRGDLWLVGPASVGREIEIHFALRAEALRILAVRVVTQGRRNFFVGRSGLVHEEPAARRLTITRGRFRHMPVAFASGIEFKIDRLHGVSRAEVIEALESDPLLVPNHEMHHHRTSAGHWFSATLASGRRLTVVLGRDEDGVLRVATAFEDDGPRAKLYAHVRRETLELRHRHRGRTPRASGTFDAAHAPARCPLRLGDRGVTVY